MPPVAWSPAENWVWEQIRAGKVADFHQHLGSTLDPRTSKGWDERRQLGVSFLREIFYDKALRDEIPPEGVRIAGALFRDKLALPDGRLHGQLRLDRSRFEQAIDLSGQTIDGWLSLEASVVAKSDGGSPSVNLTNARIDRSLNLREASIEGVRNMNGVEVGQDLLMRGSKEQPATFAEVDLSGAKVKGQVSLTGATVNGKLTMAGLEVGQDLLMRLIEPGPDERRLTASLTRVRVAGTLDLEGSAAADLDLSGANIAGELRICSMRWEIGSQLDLRNTYASVLRDDGRWPDRVLLDGFRYARLPGIGEDWHARYLTNWLGRATSYTPRPYEQLAAVLRSAAEPAKAFDVLFASRERARGLAKGWRCIGLTLLKWTIGYGLGYRYFWWPASRYQA